MQAYFWLLTSHSTSIIQFAYRQRTNKRPWRPARWVGGAYACSEGGGVNRMTSVGVVSLFSVAHMARTTFEKECAVLDFVLPPLL